jgi:hypothetical protein
VLKVAVPDFRKAIKPYIEGKGSRALMYVMGGHVDEDDKHQAIFDLETLSAHMRAAGLVNLRTWTSDVNDCAAHPVTLNLMGNRRVQRLKLPKVIAILSLPRFDFTDNRSCCENALRPLGINMELVQGVFWEQVIDRTISSHLFDGVEFILTVDGDSYFVQDHVLKLIELALTCPEADAIVPIQVKRERLTPLFGMDRKEITTTELAADLVPIKSGHFGLTLFRSSVFRNLKRPWLKGVPAPDGTWDKGRTDPDIYFWNNFVECGFKAYLAPAVEIGHLQLVSSWPGKLSDGLKPLHLYTSDVERNGPPAHCMPKLNSEFY